LDRVLDVLLHQSNRPDLTMYISSMLIFDLTVLFKLAQLSS